ncbi:hypothetical protein FRC04_005815 [Tulasnella sp. 424]|nr:hypothetical protein FRC04_005815 [Tulasnella sp. 424]
MYLDGYVIPAHETAFVATITRQLLHKRLGHIRKGRLNTLVRLKLADGIPVNGSEDVPDVCEYCIAGKQHRDPFPSSTGHRATELLALIHSDLHRPLPVTPGNQWKYWITFIDDHSRFKVIYLLRNKSDAFEAFKEYVAEVEWKLGVKVIKLRDDKGGKYVGNKFNAWCKEQGITQQRTVRATPSQNGVAEWLNQTLAEGVITMLNQANLPDYFWAPAVLYLANIHCVPPPKVSVSRNLGFRIRETSKFV